MSPDKTSIQHKYTSGLDFWIAEEKVKKAIEPLTVHQSLQQSS